MALMDTIPAPYVAMLIPFLVWLGIVAFMILFVPLSATSAWLKFAAWLGTLSL